MNPNTNWKTLIYVCAIKRRDFSFLLHLAHMCEEGNNNFIMFFTGGNIEISTMTLTAEILRPTNLLSALVLAHTRIYLYDIKTSAECIIHREKTLLSAQESIIFIVSVSVATLKK